jgi:CheY-like chemotaxis protein
MRKEPEVEYPPPEDAKPPTQTWRILFVDGAENVQKLKDACKHAGYAVVGATTIPEAWAFLEGEDRADVIVCAPHLEEGSMFEFLKGVRESELHRNAKVLILSLTPGVWGTRLDRSTASAALALGANSYAIMPVFDPHELVALIRKLQPPVPVLLQSR